MVEIQHPATSDRHGRGTLGLSRSDIVFFAVCAVFIYSQVFQLPFTPIYFEGDHLVPVSNAMRMLDGEVIYRDFFHLAPPGTELFYSTLFSIFGVRIWILNATIVLLGLLQTWLLWHFGRKVLARFWIYVPAVIYLVVGFRQFDIDGSYRIFSVVFVLFAAAVLTGRTSATRLVVAGVLCGLASFFVQTRGIVGMAGIGSFLIWEHYRGGVNIRAFLRDASLLLGCFAVTVFLTQIYFLWQAGAENYYFCLVKFLYAHYPNDPLAKTSSIFSDIPDFRSYLEAYSAVGAVSRYIRFVTPLVFYYALIPLIYIIFWIYRLRTKRSNGNADNDRAAVLLAFVGLFLALGVSVPSAGRFDHVAIPGVVILVYVLLRAKLIKPAVVVGGVILAMVGFAYIVQRQIVDKFYVDMPGGQAAFLSEPIAERYRWVAEHTKPGELFFEAQHPSFYFPMHLKNPTPMYLLRDSNYTPAFQVDATLDALESAKPRYIVWQGTWSKGPEERVAGDNLQPLWNFVQQNYEFVVEYIDYGEYTLTSERQIEVWRLKQ